MPIRVFLYGRPAHTEALRSLFEKTSEITAVGETDAENTVLDSITKLSAEVLLLYVDGNAANYRVAEQVYMLRPQCLIFALASRDTYSRESAAIARSGIQYIYEDTVTQEELIAYLKNAHTIETNRRIKLSDGEKSSAAARVLSFYSPKSGLGQTTFLASLAVALTRLKKRVILLDFDLQFGDVNTVLGLETRETLAELLQEQSSPTIEIVRRYVVNHRTGVAALCAPRNAEYAEKITGGQLEKIITALRPYYDYILIDTAPTFTEGTFTCFEQSNRVFFFVRADISSMKHSKKVMSLLESLGQENKVALILAESANPGRIDRATVEKTMGAAVWHTVPWDGKNAPEAMNQGEPLLTLCPRSAVSKECLKAGEKLLWEESAANDAGADPAAKKKRGFRKK